MGLQTKRGRIIPLVFHRAGEPIKSFRHSWDSACKAYRRYAIVNDADLHAAAQKLAALSGTRTGTIAGILALFDAREGRGALAK